MNNPALNTALKWGIENSSASGTAESDRKTQLSPEAIAAIFAGAHCKSDADLMRQYMAEAENPELDLEARVQAFDNFELLVEQLDNANNIETLGLWTSLIAQLDSEHAKLRHLAAWCCGTAVQNNLRTQERLLIVGGIPILARLAIEDAEQLVRKKAITALSSAVRNFQPGLDAALAAIPAEYKPSEKLDANDMDSVDVLINKLRENV
ncbi:Hsp70 nucleotide exchange factor FES1 [Parastagonospora nodorum]|nr:Hsp70 nucleotide exchange factor FES1 [Parastagonospora nodorum]KAH4041436.1 Hsp70 nucleotide exchange factor FES1 [Parastagonospora nodorum]KAH4058010.1 Hsp70 nucleotide exchange factor FES1 [Parastagonospora nodorum]KAH4063582.1 Hsp70 nucleotide exchange factor FES1 [Parastagonospora nodorum]KAH4083179.1 Hsp70 nucleotide exchange factor FES1 [Parastagonospora nodorum]